MTDLDKKELRDFQTWKYLNKVQERLEIEEMRPGVECMLRTEVANKILLLIAIFDGISGRQVAEKVGMGDKYSIINRLLNKWVGSGIITRGKKSCHIKDPEERKGLIALAEKMGFLTNFA